MKIADQFKKRFGNNIETRASSAPTKVFVEREGDQYEWSEDQPGLIDRFYNLLNGFYSAQNFIELFYCLPEVFAPIHEIASRVADANWQLKRDWNDEVDYKNADFNRLFSTPNPLMDHKSMVYWSVCYEILTGREFWYKNSPATLEAIADPFAATLAWWNLEAEKVHVEQNKTDPYSATELKDFIKEYSIPNSNGSKRVFDTRNVMPIFNLNLKKAFDFNNCIPGLMGAEKPIRNLIPVYEARGTIFIKRGVMGFIVSRKSDDSGMQTLTKKERLQLDKDFNRTYGLTGGKETIAMTGMPVDFIKTAMTIAEMQPFDETLSDAVAIYKVLRVPRHLVPSKDNSTFANADSDMKSFYSDVIIPWARRYAMMWNNGFDVKKIRRYIYADFSHIDCLQDNKKEKSDIEKTMGTVWSQRFLTGACSLNEWIVSFDGTKGTEPWYEMKLGDMDTETLDKVKNFLNIKTLNTQTDGQDPSSKDTAAPTPKLAN